MSNFADGLAVPIPTFPVAVTIKSVRVDDPTTNAASPAIEFTDNFANGVVVPRPSRFVVSLKKKLALSCASVPPAPTKSADPSVGPEPITDPIERVPDPQEPE